MLNKFDNPEEDIPQDNPKFAIMKAWAGVSTMYEENFWSKIQPIYVELEKQRWQARAAKSKFDYTVELEARIQKELPELAEEFGKLRQALDKVTGWHITWRHYERGEVIDSEFSQGFIDGIDAKVVIANAVRGPAQYHHNEGWVVGSQVGADSMTSMLNAWVEIASKPEAEHGPLFQLGEMYAIELTPPQAQ